MIKLHTASVKEFQRRAAQIAPNTLLPICANIKIVFKENLCLATKEAIQAGVTGQLQFTEESEPEEFLVNERIFFALAAATKSETISITKQGTAILVETTNPADRIELPWENPADYPARPEPPEQQIFKFTADHLRAIDIARNYTNDSETAGAFQFIHADDQNIFALHQNYFYINASFNKLPVASFTREEATVMCSQVEIEFMDSPGYHTFFTPGYTYTFAKTEVKAPAQKAILDRLRLPGKDFTVNRDEIVEFLNLANAVSESPVTTCTLSPEGLFVRLKMNDASYSRGNERMITCTGTPDEFTFNSRLVLAPMKAIPYEILGAKTNGNCMIVSSGEEWFCFLGMSKN